MLLMTSNWSEKIILGGAFSEDIQTYSFPSSLKTHPTTLGRSDF